jgi:hypothetical protein
VKTPTAARLGTDWTLAHEDTMGELQTALMFSEWAGADAGRTLAEGWGGDRSATFVRGDEVALSIVVRFDEPRFAARAWSALAPALSRATRGATTKEKNALCIERPSLGPLSLRVKGDSLAITAGPTIACKAALAWAEEALSPR